MPLSFTTLTRSNPMATPSKKPMGTWRILWESLKLPTKNLTLMLPLLSLSLLTSNIFFLANYYTTTPSLFDIMTKFFAISSSSPQNLKPLLTIIGKDLSQLVINESISIPISFIISSFIFTTMVKAISSIHLKEHITLRELFTRVSKSWKGLVITQLLVAIINLGCVFLFMVLLFFFCALILTGSISVWLIVFGVIIIPLVLFLYLGVVVVLALGEMVSVLEDGCYGFCAMARAMELFKEKKRQGMVIFFVVMLISGAISTSVHPLIKGILMANLVEVWAVVETSAITVLYYECKKSRGEEIMVSGKEGFMYKSLSNGSYGEGDLAA